MYIIALAALVRVADTLPEVRLRAIFLFGIGLGLVLSVRIAGLVVLGYFGCLIGFFVVQEWARREEKGMLPSLAGLLDSRWKRLSKLLLLGVGAAGSDFFYFWCGGRPGTRIFSLPRAPPFRHCIPLPLKSPCFSADSFTRRPMRRFITLSGWLR